MTKHGTEKRLTRHTELRWFITLGALGWALSAGGCVSPRDADLDMRLLAVDPSPSATETTAKGAPSKATAGAAAPNPTRSFKSYTDNDIKRILGNVPGDGTTLAMIITTASGTINCQLDRERAPQSVTNLVGLATAQVGWTDPDGGGKRRSPFYKGLPFHRIVQNFLIQTGNPAVTNARGPAWRSKGPGWVIAREQAGDVHYDKPGAIGLVDAGDDSHGSQFFITTKRATHLKNKYAAIGFCENLDVVTRIANAPKLNPDKEKPTRPKTPVRIEQLEIRWITAP